MITAVIIDDEPAAVNTLLESLSRYYKTVIEVLQVAQSVEEGIEVIREQNPNLVFLDIELHDQSGFDVLRKFPNPRFDLICTTAHPEYALEAIHFSTLHYLLKPIDLDKLDSAINRVLSKISQHELVRKIDVLLSNLDNPDKKILLPTESDSYIVDKDELVKIEAKGDSSKVYLRDKRSFVVSKTLAKFEMILAKYGFFRVHDSHMINLRDVDRYDRRSRTGVITLKDKTTVLVSEKRKTAFLEVLEAWQRKK